MWLTSRTQSAFSCAEWPHWEDTELHYATSSQLRAHTHTQRATKWAEKKSLVMCRVDSLIKVIVSQFISIRIWRKQKRLPLLKWQVGWSCRSGMLSAAGGAIGCCLPLGSLSGRALPMPGGKRNKRKPSERPKEPVQANQATESGTKEDNESSLSFWFLIWWSHFFSSCGITCGRKCSLWWVCCFFSFMKASRVFRLCYSFAPSSRHYFCSVSDFHKHFSDKSWSGVEWLAHTPSGVAHPIWSRGFESGFWRPVVSRAKTNLFERAHWLPSLSRLDLCAVKNWTTPDLDCIWLKGWPSPWKLPPPSEALIVGQI